MLNRRTTKLNLNAPTAPKQDNPPQPIAHTSKASMEKIKEIYKSGQHKSQMKEFIKMYRFGLSHPEHHIKEFFWSLMVSSISLILSLVVFVIALLNYKSL